MAKRKKHQITEYEKCLREYHKASPRHVIVLETDLLEDEKRHLFHQADLLRQCGNKTFNDKQRKKESKNGAIKLWYNMPNKIQILSSNDPEYMKKKVIYAYEHNLLEVDC